MGNQNLNNLTFEEAYAQLETIVARLEGSNLALDESLSLFEQGQALAAYCQKLLESAELRVTQLAADGSTFQALDE
ncbi:MAG: exodeoxyribonuclease VII small subunit [Chloroflexi bacterium]|nr:exodeoxyribonuclease VII small subunit [Chloroflexota bacterium]